MVHTLKPGDYLKTSEEYRKLSIELLRKYPIERDLIEKIYPKYRLGGLHVLAKSNDYSTFRLTVIKDGYRKDMKKLIFHGNAKLSVYALLYCISLRAFYIISR